MKTKATTIIALYIMCLSALRIARLHSAIVAASLSVEWRSASCASRQWDRFNGNKQCSAHTHTLHEDGDDERLQYPGSRPELTRWAEEKNPLNYLFIYFKKFRFDICTQFAHTTRHRATRHGTHAVRRLLKRRWVHHPPQRVVASHSNVWNVLYANDFFPFVDSRHNCFGRRAPRCMRPSRQR